MGKNSPNLATLQPGKCVYVYVKACLHEICFFLSYDDTFLGTTRIKNICLTAFLSYANIL
jgi:hypothetical protein